MQRYGPRHSAGLGPGKPACLHGGDGYKCSCQVFTVYEFYIMFAAGVGSRIGLLRSRRVV